MWRFVRSGDVTPVRCLLGASITVAPTVGLRRRDCGPCTCSDEKARRVVVFLSVWDRFAGPVQEKLISSKGAWDVICWRPGTDRREKLHAQLHGREVSAVVGGPESNSVLDSLPGLQLLQVPFTGTDWLAREKVPPGCAVCNVHGMDPPVAEYVLGTMLDWTVGFSKLDAEFKSDGVFRPPFPRPGYRGRPFHDELGGKTLGIVGFGAIGTEIAKRAAAFDMRIIATARTPRDALPADLAWLGTSSSDDLERLLKESDFVVLACPLTAETQGLIDESRLQLMKPTAVLINVARGAVVEEAALWDALSSKRIGGAIIDVWWGTHESGDPSAQGYPWHKLGNTVMTPHSSGWTSAGAEGRRHTEIAANLDALHSGGPLRNCVVAARA